jgi:hypothetical protein
MHQYYIFFLFIRTYVFRLFHSTTMRALEIKEYSRL